MRILGPCRLALGQDCAAPRESFDADLGSLQVAEHRDVLAHHLRRAAHVLDTLAVILRLAVREVDAHHVGPATDDLLDGALCVGGGAEGSDDLGAAKHGEKRIADSG